MRVHPTYSDIIHSTHLTHSISGHKTVIGHVQPAASLQGINTADKTICMKGGQRDA